MNAEVYLFGKSTQDQYFQYPQDYTQSVFQNFQHNIKGKTQLFIRRSGNDLVYYGYIRKIGNSKNEYIGLCFVLNSILITDEKALFRIFENMVGNLIKNNRLVELDVQGVLVSKSFTSKDIQKEFDSFRLNIQLELDVLDYTNSYLPPLNNNITLPTFSITHLIKTILISEMLFLSVTLSSLAKIQILIPVFF